MRLLKKQRSTERTGATIAEVAVMMPIFVLIIFAMFEFTRMAVLRHTADNAAYEAARIAMVTGGTAQDARDEANRILNIVRTNGAQVTVQPAVITDATEQITVSIDVPMDQNGWILPKFSAGQNIFATCTLRTERARTR